MRRGYAEEAAAAATVAAEEVSTEEGGFSIGVVVVVVVVVGYVESLVSTLLDSGRGTRSRDVTQSRALFA